MRSATWIVVAIITVPGAIAAQRPLAQRLHDAGTRTVAFNARSRPEVCGDGIRSYNDGLSGPLTRYYDGFMLVTHEPWDNRIAPCDPGPVRVTVRVVDGTPTWLRVAAGPLPALGDSVLDLGGVSDAEASVLLTHFAREGDGRIAAEALMPLVLLDSTPRWELLASAARDSSRLLAYRRRASDLLARAAASTIAAEPNVDNDTRSARRDAVYALARQREQNEDVVPELLEIAQRNQHRDARVAALYQLGQRADPRAVQLFSTMLQGK